MHSFLGYAPDKQTNKQTDSNILPTPIVGVGNKYFVYVKLIEYLKAFVKEFERRCGPSRL